jgi:hypothetical protein
VRREIERAVSKGVVLLPFRIEDVFPCKTLEYFLGTQHWLDAFQKPLEPHIETLTRTVKAILANSDPDMPLWGGADLAQLSAAPVAAEPAATPSAPAAPGAAFAAQQLALLEHELALHIGPLAKVLVGRAAQRATSLDELVGQLAAEIGDAAERADFVAAVTRTPA